MVAPVRGVISPPSLVTDTLDLPTNWLRKSSLVALAPRPEVSEWLMMDTPEQVPSVFTPTMMSSTPPKPEGATWTT